MFECDCFYCDCNCALLLRVAGAEKGGEAGAEEAGRGAAGAQEPRAPHEAARGDGGGLQGAAGQVQAPLRVGAAQGGPDQRWVIE